MHRPVFYDASGRGRRLTLPALFVMLIVILAAGMAFAFTIVEVPVLADLRISFGSGPPADQARE